MKPKSKFSFLDKQGINKWVNKKELTQLKKILRDVVERYEKFFPVIGLPYGWTTEKELKSLHKKIKNIFIAYEDFYMGGIAHYGIGFENTFAICIVFSKDSKKRRTVNF